MKKLLAIAVAAAFAVPMAASADVTVGGTVDLIYNFGDGATNKTIVDDSGDSEIRIKASTPLFNGMTGTAAVTHEFDASGGNAATDHTDAKLGIKGGFGHVTLGNVSKPMDAIDSVVGFLPADFDHGNGDGSQGINYTGTFGGITAMAMVRPKAENTLKGNGTKSQLGLIYKAGPFVVGLGLGDNATGSSNPETRVALAYNGSNYNVGAQYDEADNGSESTVIGGKYSFGRAYVSASFADKNDVDMNSVKVGYALGKSTSVFLKSTDTGAADRSNVMGITQNF